MDGRAVSHIINKANNCEFGSAYVLHVSMKNGNCFNDMAVVEFKAAFDLLTVCTTRNHAIACSEREHNLDIGQISSIEVEHG